MKKIIFIAFCMIVSIQMANAQVIDVKTFKELPTSAEARTNPRKDDYSANNCAIIKVKADNIKEFKFDGKIVGDIEYKNGEAWIYVSPQSNYLDISHDKYKPKTYESSFPFGVEKVYEMNIVIANNKIRTLILPTVGLGKCMNYGLMVGFVKKFGGYIKAKYNFKNASTELETNKEGYSPTGNEMWFSGNKEQSRLAITGGAMFRVLQPLYVYGGLGYGFYTSAWETSDGQWAKNTDYSNKGIEFEVGLVGRWKNLALGAGVQSCQMKYWEANVSIGVMF